MIFGLRDADLTFDEDDSSDEDVRPARRRPPRPWHADEISDDEYDEIAIDEPLTYVPNPHGLPRTAAEQREIDDALVSIRLRCDYVDPVQEWQKNAQKEALNDASIKHKENLTRLHDLQLRAAQENVRKVAEVQRRQLEEVRNILENMKLSRQKEEEKCRREYEERDRALWSKVDKVIKDEEQKIAMQKAEEERQRKEEEERRAREEKRKKEEEEKRLAAERERQLQEQLAKAKKEKEEAEEKERLEAEKKIKVAEQESAEIRSQVGLSSAEDEWNEGRQMLQRLKTEVHPAIKADRALKTLRNQLRRQITPKVGQLTADVHQIDRITHELQAILLPNPPHPPVLYTALLSALAKAFLLQAETEVTAKDDTALPIARVMVSLLISLPNFGDVLFARLVQRIGIWAVPFGAKPSPTATKEEKDAIMGVRREDTDNEKRLRRIRGVMTVFFCIMHTPHPQSLPEKYRLGRFWTYIARLVSSRDLATTSVAVEIIRVALMVAGTQALRVWGRQWVKMLQLIDKGIDENSGPTRSLIGGEGIEGTAGRVRVKLEIQKALQ
ncbi:hypothetical protein SISNIDRAFT_479576 [Sistotremastrum niveocremeum HHB9708]|uniref:mRNA export factor GLE1 n=1 Tax=Sistotremastrum niveocremeum HHB9708 TaxID=1314777 RepID=A0A164R2F0_9AGAM|nr:hypothetical protein SISNIDRAFT_479576 [Sistotremastrum niveocremeum HHB9708]